MPRVNFNLTDGQHNFLKENPSTSVSEHIRRALNDYILKLRNISAASSVSETLEIIEDYDSKKGGKK